MGWDLMSRELAASETRPDLLDENMFTSEYVTALGPRDWRGTTDYLLKRLGFSLLVLWATWATWQYAILYTGNANLSAALGQQQAAYSQLQQQAQQAVQQLQRELQQTKTIP